MTSAPKVQWAPRVVTSQTKYRPLRPQFARHGTSEVASTARNKLDNQAGRSEHDLRLLVGHANTLDYLMEKLYARQQDQASKHVTGTAEAETTGTESSQDGHPQSLRGIPEESNDIAPTEQTSFSNDPRDNPSVIRKPEEASEFAPREDKELHVLSIVHLLGSDSDSDSSEESDVDADSESDSDNNASSI